MYNNEPSLKELYELVPKSLHEDLNKWVQGWVDISFAKTRIPMHELFTLSKEDESKAYFPIKNNYRLPSSEEISGSIKQCIRHLAGSFDENQEFLDISTNVEKGQFSEYVITVSLLGLRRKKRDEEQS